MTADGRCSVLVVEDDVSIAEFVESVLSEEGYGVRLAEDGEEGLRLMRSERPDVILLDLLLPGMGGEAFLRQARDEGATAPVILMTATREAEAQGHVAAEGLLLKPFELGNLLSEVERVLATQTCEKPE